MYGDNDDYSFNNGFQTLKSEIFRKQYFLLFFLVVLLFSFIVAGNSVHHFVTDNSDFTPHFSIDNGQLSIIHYPLSIIHYPLSIIHYPLSIIHYPKELLSKSKSTPSLLKFYPQTRKSISDFLSHKNILNTIAENLLWRQHPF